MALVGRNFGIFLCGIIDSAGKRSGLSLPIGRAERSIIPGVLFNLSQLEEFLFISIITIIILFFFFGGPLW